MMNTGVKKATVKLPKLRTKDELLKVRAPGPHVVLGDHSHRTRTNE